MFYFILFECNGVADDEFTPLRGPECVCVLVFQVQQTLWVPPDEHTHALKTRTYDV